MISWPTATPVLVPISPTLVPTLDAQPQPYRDVALDFMETGPSSPGTEALGLGRLVTDDPGPRRLPKIVRALQGAVVHGCVHLAAASPSVAVFFDLQLPVGPSVLNPVGRVDTDAPLYALAGLAVGNGILAPYVVQAMLENMSAPNLYALARRRHRQSALVHGGLGAMVALMTAALACGGLRDELAWRSASTGWENGAFPSSYYWQALSFSAHASLPLAALIGFHLTSHFRAKKLLGPELPAGVELLELNNQP